MVRSPPRRLDVPGWLPRELALRPPTRGGCPRGGGAHICYGFQLRVAVPVGAVNLLQGFGHFPGAFVHHCGGVAKIQGVERQRGSGPPRLHRAAFPGVGGCRRGACALPFTALTKALRSL